MGTKNLGPVTAYAYAKEHGYTGTEEQFEALMGALPSAVTNAQEAVTTVTTLSAQATKVSPTSPASATYNHTTNKLEFNIPEGNGITSVALTSTSGAAKTYTITFDDGTTTNFVVTDGEVTQEVLDETVEEITNGYFDNMTVGSAEQLVSSIMEEDTKPYVFRTTGGSLDVGDRKTEELVGGTIAWNQLVPTACKSATYTAPSDSSAYNVVLKYPDPVIHVTASHKYLISGKITRTISGKNGIGICFWAGNTYRTAVGVTNGASDGYYPFIYSSNITEDWDEITANNHSAEGKDGFNAGDTVSYDDLMVSDLTQMFGSTIADYIYGLEQAEAGAGVAWFKKFFPKPYYAYDAGSLQSVNVASGINTGFNQWDEEWELGTYNTTTGAKETSNDRIRSKNYIKVLPDTSYYMTVPAGNTNTYIYFYDADKNYISYISSQNTTFVTPSNCYYMMFRLHSSYGTTYKNDICINLHWDGERDGEYEPYDAHVYNYDSDLELRGIPSLDEFGNLQYDGDIYGPDGTVTRKYDAITSTDFSLIRTTEQNMKLYGARKEGHWKLSTNNIINNYGLPIGSFNSATETSEKMQPPTDGGSAIYLLLSSESRLADFRVVCELATPTEETADPFTSPQVINDFGTEEWVDAGVEAETRDVTVPVGHNSAYMVNLKAKLEMAPNSPDGDGEYLVRQKDGENEYIPFSWSGDHPDLSAGSAHQLISTVQENDQTPYLFRTSGGAVDIGDREFINGIVGGTVAWNQLAYDNASDYYNINVTVTKEDGAFTVSNTASSSNGKYARIRLAQTNHIYLISGSAKTDGVATMAGLGLYKQDSGQSAVIEGRTTDWTSGSVIGKALNDSYFLAMRIHPNSSAVGVKCYFKDPQVFDLTQMFGSTIADYIYSLETATAGAGVAFFKKLFPKPYYEYNAGELLSVSGLQSHDMTGFNQWDEEWELGGISSATGANTSSTTTGRSKNYIPVLPNTNYYAKCPNRIYTRFYDADMNYLGYLWSAVDGSAINQVFVTPPNCYYMRFVYDTAIPTGVICINLAWDNSRNGEYEPYVKHSYPLDSSLTLRGIPKLDANNELYYDGDIYEADGTVTRKYADINLGDLTWANCASATDAQGRTVYYSSANVGVKFKEQPISADLKNAISSIGKQLRSDPIAQLNITEFSYTIGNTNQGDIWALFIDQSRTASQVKDFFRGQHLVCELATPTTETADPYTTPQIVDDFGTEEFVIDSEIAVPIPVGHNTDYPINLVAKVEMAPNSPEGDGDYIVRQTSGTNEYVALGSTSVITDILNRLQALENQE